MSKVEYNPEETREIDVFGEKHVIKSMCGMDYMDLIGKCSDLQGKIDRRKYTQLLFRQCIVSPKRDPSKYSAPAALLLFSEIENMLGVAELMQKNLLKIPGAKE